MNDTRGKHNVSCAPHCCGYSWGLRAAHAPELLQGSWSGWAGFVGWESPSSTLLPRLLPRLLTAGWWQLVPHWAVRSSWSARGNCCEPAGVAQRPSTHCRGRSSPAAFISWRGGWFLETCRELAAGGMHRGTRPHAAPPSPGRELLAAAGPAPGCLRKGFPFLPHPQRPGAILPSKAQVNNLTS